MRTSRMTLALLGALLALGLSWVAADAQSAADGNSGNGSMRFEPGGGYVRADTTKKAFTMSSTGGLSIYDESPDREAYHIWQDIIQADSTAGPDSSSGGVNGLGSIIDTYAYRHLTLLIKAWPINHQATTFKRDIRLAVQVRMHINGLDDSLSTFVLHPYGVGAAGVGTGAVAKGDTLTTGHVTTGTTNLPWSGEFVVNIAGNRAAHTGQAIGTDHFYYPSGIAIPLDSVFGRDVWAPGISVRVRILDTDSWKWGGSIHLVGTAL